MLPAEGKARPGEFRVYKFRTMVDGAKKATGAQLATERDPRVTRLGAALGIEQTLVLLRFFVQHNGKKLTELSKAACDRDPDRLGSPAHHILGSAVNLHLDVLGDIARRIEDRAIREDFDGLFRDVGDLKIAFEVVSRVTRSQAN